MNVTYANTGMLNRRRLIQVGLLTLLASPVIAVNAAMPISAALNRTARFRGNSQRCAKAYCQIQLKVMPDFSQELLANVQRQIASNFEALNAANFSGEILSLFNALRSENVALINSLGAPANRASVLAVSQQADRMFAAANRLTEGLQVQSKQTSAQLINQSGLLRNRSQRLAKNFFLVAAGHDSKDIRDLLSSDRSDFLRAMDALGKAPISTAAIRNDLGLLQSQWTFFEAALNRRADDESMRHVATASERIHDVGDSLAGLYEAALRDLLGSTS